MFSDNLLVYDRRKACWERRTPNGVGWFPHLLSMIDMQGHRTDDFDQFLKRNVEDPAAPALKKMAQASQVDEQERSAIALFIGLTAARSPKLVSQTFTEYVEKLPDNERRELDSLTEVWCELTGREHGPKSNSEFLKPSSFGGIWVWAKSLQQRLLQWQWHILQTTRDKPFVTSDRPVFLQWDRDQDVRFVGFPVSSEVALIVNSAGQLREGRDQEQDVCALNRQTMGLATDFIAACSRTFPADGFLQESQGRETL